MKMDKQIHLISQGYIQERKATIIIINYLLMNNLYKRVNGAQYSFGLILIIILLIFKLLLMNLSEQEEEARFRTSLRQFWASKGITQMKIPQIGGQELDLLKLYRSVCQRGGGQGVSNNKLWKQIVDEFGLPSSCTSASFTLKNHYQKYLLAYQQKYYFGRDDDAELPELVAGRLRKQIKLQQSNHNKEMNKGLMPQRSNLGMRDSNQHEPQLSTLSNELNKQYEKVDKSQLIFYLKRSKMYPLLSEVKRIILGLSSRIKSEVIYSLNMLLLYSVNTHTPFKFEQFPNVIDALTSYTLHIFPPKNVEQLEQLRNITLILRNLTLNEMSNLFSIKQSNSLLNLLLKIFETNFDKECIKNIIDIMNGLIKIGWDPYIMYHKLIDHLQSDRVEEIQYSLDLIRTLTDYKCEGIENFILSHIESFVKFLVYNSSDMREVALEVISHLSQMSNETKVILAKHARLIARVVAILGINSRNQKVIVLAANILKNLISYPAAKEWLIPFEKDIAIIASSCEGIINEAAMILNDLVKIGN